MLLYVYILWPLARGVAQRCPGIVWFIPGKGGSSLCVEKLISSDCEHSVQEELVSMYVYVPRGTGIGHLQPGVGGG